MKNIYLIYGNDKSLVENKINEIKQNFNEVLKYDLLLDNINDLVIEASCASLFGDNKLIIGLNATFLTNEKPSNNKIDYSYFIDYLKSSDKINTVIISVVSDKLDERKNIVKQLRENADVIYVEEIKTNDLPNYVINYFSNKGYKISYNDALYFISYVGDNIDIITSEMKKMIIYKGENNIITKDDINNISSKYLNDNVFLLCDSIMKKDYKKIFSYYNDFVSLKIDETKLLSVIANQFIFLYDVKLLYSKNKTQSEIASILSSHPYRVKLACQSDYLIYEIKDIIKKLHELDFKMKSSNVDKKSLFEKFLIDI